MVVQSNRDVYFVFSDSAFFLSRHGDGFLSFCSVFPYVAIRARLSCFFLFFSSTTDNHNNRNNSFRPLFSFMTTRVDSFY